MLTVSQTGSLLRTFDNVLILTHDRPDGDTVGWAAALCAGLAQPRLSQLVDAIGSAFGLVLGMTGAGALILLVSLVSAVTAVVS